MRKHKLLLPSLVLIAVALAVGAYFSVLYWQGGSSNYEPPKQTYASPQERARADLQNLSQAVEAYFIKNMEYPGKLELLQPEFLDHVTKDPLSGKTYLYTLSESEGASRYRIGVPDPKLYNAKEFYIEDGKIVQR